MFVCLPPYTLVAGKVIAISTCVAQNNRELEVISASPHGSPPWVKYEWTFPNITVCSTTSSHVPGLQTDLPSHVTPARLSRPRDQAMCSHVTKYSTRVRVRLKTQLRLWLLVKDAGAARRGRVLAVSFWLVAVAGFPNAPSSDVLTIENAPLSMASWICEMT